MAAPSIIRRSRQRQGVVILHEAKRTAALIFVQNRRGIGMAWKEGYCTTAFFLCRRPAAF